MNPSAPERQGDMFDVDRSAAAAAVRYRQSAVGYPLRALTESGPRPTRIGPRIALKLARLRRLRQRGSTLLWWIPLWYVLGQLSLFLWMDDSWQLNRTLVERDKWKQVHERLAEAPDRPFVVMFGSSRTDWAFQAGRLTSQPGPDGRPLLAYNMGLPTTGPIHATYYLNELLNEGVRPRLVLLEFVGTHLNQSRRNLLSEEHFTLPRRISGRQLLFFRRYFSNPRRSMGVWLEARLAPWYSFSFFVHEHIQGRCPEDDPRDPCKRPMDAWGCRMLGYDPGTPEYRSQRWAFAFNMYGQSLQQFKLGAGPAQAMRDFLARCRQENIPVAIVVLPVTKEFEALYCKVGKAELENFLAELVQSYDAHLIDASNWLKTEEFDDGHHVLKIGAEKFTTRMIDEIQKILALTEPHAEQQSTLHHSLETAKEEKE